MSATCINSVPSLADPFLELLSLGANQNFWEGRAVVGHRRIGQGSNPRNLYLEPGGVKIDTVGSHQTPLRQTNLFFKK